MARNQIQRRRRCLAGLGGPPGWAGSAAAACAGRRPGVCRAVAGRPVSRAGNGGGAGRNRGLSVIGIVAHPECLQPYFWIRPSRGLRLGGISSWRRPRKCSSSFNPSSWHGVCRRADRVLCRAGRSCGTWTKCVVTRKANLWRSARCTGDEISTVAAGASLPARQASDRVVAFLMGQPIPCRISRPLERARGRVGSEVAPRPAPGGRSAQALPGEAGGTGDVGVASDGVGDGHLHAGDPDLGARIGAHGGGAQGRDVPHVDARRALRAQGRWRGRTRSSTRGCRRRRRGRWGRRRRRRPRAGVCRRRRDTTAIRAPPGPGGGGPAGNRAGGRPPRR